MTPTDALKQAKPADFVGEFTASLDGGDTKVPVVDVYKGKMPDGTAPKDGEIYEFLPISGAETGDVITDAPLAAIAIEGIHKAGDRVEGHLTLIVKGADSAEAIGRNPVTEGGARFARLLEVVTREEGINRLRMTPSTDTDVPEQSLRRLGFEPVEGSDEVQIDLPAAKRTA